MAKAVTSIGGTLLATGSDEVPTTLDKDSAEVSLATDDLGDVRVNILANGQTNTVLKNGKGQAPIHSKWGVRRDNNCETLVVTQPHAVGVDIPWNGPELQ